MGYVTGTKYNALDAYPAASQNQDVDNDTFLYDNLLIENASYAPDRPSAAVVVSDEFNAGALNVAWTAGVVAAGTVVELETGAVDDYDLASFPGWLAFQTDTAADAAAMTDAYVRRVWAPGTGPWSVVAKVSLNYSTNAAANQFIGIGFSDNTTPTNWTQVKVGRLGGGAISVRSAQNAGTISTATLAEPTGVVYLALVRESAGGTTRMLWSKDGISWAYEGTTATAVNPGYLWIFIQQGGAPAQRPIYMVDFIRTFSSAILKCGRRGTT